YFCLKFGVRTISFIAVDATKYFVCFNLALPSQENQVEIRSRLTRSLHSRVGPSIAPRAPHRSVRDSLPSHGSCHPEESCRPPPQPVSSSRFQLALCSGGMAYPLRSTDITPFHHYYKVSRPSMLHPHFRPRRSDHLRLFR